MIRLELQFQITLKIPQDASERDVKRNVLRQTPRQYDTQHTLRDAIKRAISESRIEYRFLGLAYEKDGVQLKKYYENL
jgi:hypothetical protein